MLRHCVVTTNDFSIKQISSFSFSFARHKIYTKRHLWLLWGQKNGARCYKKPCDDDDDDELRICLSDATCKDRSCRRITSLMEMEAHKNQFLLHEKEVLTPVIVPSRKRVEDIQNQHRARRQSKFSENYKSRRSQMENIWLMIASFLYANFLLENLAMFAQPFNRKIKHFGIHADPTMAGLKPFQNNNQAEEQINWCQLADISISPASMDRTSPRAAQNSSFSSLLRRKSPSAFNFITFISQEKSFSFMTINLPENEIYKCSGKKPMGSTCTAFVNSHSH